MEICTCYFEKISLLGTCICLFLLMQAHLYYILTTTFSVKINRYLFIFTAKEEAAKAKPKK